MKKLFFIPILLLACMGMRATDVSDFSGLNAALSAGGTSNVTLKSDITLTTNITINGTKTIDFGTYTVTAGNYSFTVASDATVTFTASIGGIRQSGSSKTCISVDGGIITVNGGNYVTTGNQIFSTNATKGGNITIHDGYFECSQVSSNANTRVILAASGSNVEITGGVLKGNAYGIFATGNNVKITLSGGTITAGRIGSTGVANQGNNSLISISGSTSISAATAIKAAKGKLEILGCDEIEGTDGVAIDLSSALGTDSISIYGGTFVGSITASDALKAMIAAKGGFIYSGYWTTNVMQYCAVGYEALLEDCYVHVTPALTPALQINSRKFFYKLESTPGPGDGYYATPYEAYLAAMSTVVNGDTITLLSHIPIAKNDTLRDTVYVDFGQYTLNSDTSALVVDVDAVVFFKGTTGGVLNAAAAAGNAAAPCLRVYGEATFVGGHYVTDGNQAVVCYAGSTTLVEDGYFQGGSTANRRAILIYGDKKKETLFEVRDGSFIGNNNAIFCANEHIDLIISGGSFSSNVTRAAAIQHANSGSVLISGDAVISGATGIFMSAGTLTITGGQITGAKNVAVDLRAYKVTETDTIAISGGVFTGNGRDSALVVSTDLRNALTERGGCLSGGYYYLSNVSAPYNYCIYGRAAKLSEESGYEDYYEVVEGYQWLNSLSSSNWNDTLTWETIEETPQNVTPTAAMGIIVRDGYSIMVDTISFAYHVIIQSGCTLTVQNGQSLTVGAGGIDMADGGKLIIEPEAVLQVGHGGYRGTDVDALIIEASETSTGVLRLDPSTTYKHPIGTVQMYAKAHVGGTESDPIYYSQHIGIPTYETPSMEFPSGGYTYFDVYNKRAKMEGTDTVVDMWSGITALSELKPFIGYRLNFESSIAGHPYASTNPAGIYAYKGALVGCENMSIKFLKAGYNLLANSYTAPISIKALLNALESNYTESDSVQLNVWIFNSSTLQHEHISAVEVADDDQYIAPMQGFILYCGQTRAAATKTLSYSDAVWGTPRQSGEPIKSPLMRQGWIEQEDGEMIWIDDEPIEETTDYSIHADIIISSATSQDKVVFRESDTYSEMFDKGADVFKLKGESVFNIFSVNDALQLSQVATDNLSGKTLTIQAKGEMTYTMSFGRVNNFDYAIRDMVTDQVIDVVEGNTYTFNVTPNTTAYDRFVLEAGDHKLPTGCEKVVTSKHMGVYTMLGQYLGTAEQLDNLPAGVYVVNGQRVVK